MYLPSPRQLQYLVALLDHRHFGRAAEACFVTQSTLSVGLQELEAGLDAALIERTKRKVIPTPLGMEIGQRARTLLRDMADLVEAARPGDGTLSGPLRLGVIPTIGPFVLPRVLPALRHDHPNLRPLLREDQTAKLLERLHRGDIDCALIALPYDIRGLECAEVLAENFWLAVPKGHPLAVASQISSADLPPDELLMLEDGHCLRDHALAACRLQGLRRSAAFEGTSLYTLVQMVAGGQGLTFLPELALRSEGLKEADWVLRPLDEPGPHRVIALVWRPSFPRAESLRLLATALADQLTTT
ncbi:hydrogen peroxide-inducible genes activator [Magnetospira sp. QH-2]|uniref:hydrogen peroxide-inducible genes activator n=1 Tax=Magnetospira sp. (strain QH-2) TaxID=1288970 RepID=UPI0003E81ABA|nr:hydrogen peroxide-inducible genes activator [Magnetospira sp. QH-2]CCQ72391.1 Hydrogen peroxide-inducible gene activator (Transcriptional regulator, LysR family) [Magnetospira sp. QH-2]